MLITQTVYDLLKLGQVDHFMQTSPHIIFNQVTFCEHNYINFNILTAFTKLKLNYKFYVNLDEWVSRYQKLCSPLQICFFYIRELTVIALQETLKTKYHQFVVFVVAGGTVTCTPTLASFKIILKELTNSGHITGVKWTPFEQHFINI